MSDFTDNLRARAAWDREHQRHYTADLHQNSADEIEQLRAALREISKIGPRFEARGTSITKMLTIARRALEGK